MKRLFSVLSILILLLPGLASGNVLLPARGNSSYRVEEDIDAGKYRIEYQGAEKAVVAVTNMNGSYALEPFTLGAEYGQTSVEVELNPRQRLWVMHDEVTAVPLEVAPPKAVQLTGGKILISANDDSFVTLVAGKDIAPGMYRIEYAGGSTAFVQITNRGVDYALKPVRLGYPAGETSVNVELIEGQTLWIKGDDVNAVPISQQAFQEAWENDPLRTLIPGVDLAEALKDAAQDAAGSSVFPLVTRLNYSFDKASSTVLLTLTVDPVATDRQCFDYLQGAIRRLATFCFLQNPTIAPPSAASYGGIYDVVSCTVGVFRGDELLYAQHLPVGLQELQDLLH